MGEWDDLKAISLGDDMTPVVQSESIPGVDWGPEDPEAWKEGIITLRFKTFGRRRTVHQLLQGAIRALRLAGYDVEALYHTIRTTKSPSTSEAPGVMTPGVTQGGESHVGEAPPQPS